MGVPHNVFPRGWSLKSHLNRTVSRGLNSGLVYSARFELSSSRYASLRVGPTTVLR